MTFLNWLPETVIIMQLFFAIGLLSFFRKSTTPFCLLFSFINLLLFFYFGFRSDLSHFDSPYRILSSDGFAIFGRFFSILFISLSGLYLHFHREMTVYSKQAGMIFILFSGLFFIVLFSSESVLFFVLGWFGVYLSLTRFILLESRENTRWISALGARTLPLALLMLCFSLVFMITAQRSHSIYISDFLVMSKSVAHDWPILCLGFLIYLVAGLMLFGFNLSGDAPFGIALFSLFLFLAEAGFLIRIGIPFLSETMIFSKVYEQNILGGILGAFALKHAYRAVKTERHFEWLTSIYFASVALGLFALLLDVDAAVPLLYMISFSFLFTFLFMGNTFLETKYYNKISILVGLLGTFGIPPLILGEQYFQLIHHLFEGGLALDACIFIFSWFLLSVATVKMVGRVILVKNGVQTHRKTQAGEMILIAVYFLGVIALTAFKPTLISLLNDRPLPYLW